MGYVEDRTMVLKRNRMRQRALAHHRGTLAYHATPFSAGLTCLSDGLRRMDSDRDLQPPARHALLSWNLNRQREIRSPGDIRELEVGGRSNTLCAGGDCVGSGEMVGSECRCRRLALRVGQDHRRCTAGSAECPA